MLGGDEYEVGDEIKCFVESVSKQSGRFTVSTSKPSPQSKDDKKIEKLKEDGTFDLVMEKIDEPVSGKIIGRGYNGGGYVKDEGLKVVGRVEGEVGEVGGRWEGKVKGIEGGEVWFV